MLIVNDGGEEDEEDVEDDGGSGETSSAMSQPSARGSKEAFPFSAIFVTPLLTARARQSNLALSTFDLTPSSLRYGQIISSEAHGTCPQ